MKHALILLSVVFCLGFTNAPSFTAMIHPGKDASVLLVLENPKKERLNLVVRHTQYGIISDTMITSAKFRCQYNLDAVDDGEFVLEVSNGKDHLVQRFFMMTETKIERKVSIEPSEAGKRAF